MTNGKTVESNAQSNVGEAVLGYLVWFGLNKVHEPEENVQAMWETAGLSEDLTPCAPSLARAFNIAVREAEVGSGFDAKLVRKEAAFALYSVKGWTERVDANGTVVDVDASTAVQFALVYDREEVVGGAGHPFIEAVREGFAHHKGYVCSDELRPSVTQSIRAMAGIPLRHNRGVYFVPASGQEEVERLQGMVESCGASELYAVPQADGAQVRKGVASSAVQTFQAELASIKAELGSFRTRSQDPSGPALQQGTVKRRLDAISDLKERAAIYMEALGIQQDQLLGGVDDLKALAEDIAKQL